MRLFIVIFIFLFPLQPIAVSAITFKELSDQIHYLTLKDKVISQNVANINTPGYLPKKVEKPIDINVLSLDLTDSRHISYESSMDVSLSNEEILELKPNGNGVTVEAELAKKSENSLELKEIASLFYKSKSMIQTALTGGSK